MIARLKLMKNLGHVSLFSSMITVPVEQCGFRDSVGSVGAYSFFFTRSRS